MKLQEINNLIHAENVYFISQFELSKVCFHAQHMGYFHKDIYIYLKDHTFLNVV